MSGVIEVTKPEELLTCEWRLKLLTAGWSKKYLLVCFSNLGWYIGSQWNKWRLIVNLVSLKTAMYIEEVSWVLLWACYQRWCCQTAAEKKVIIGILVQSLIIAEGVSFLWQICDSDVTFLDDRDSDVMSRFNWFVQLTARSCAVVMPCPLLLESFKYCGAAYCRFQEMRIYIWKCATCLLSFSLSIVQSRLT